MTIESQTGQRLSAEEEADFWRQMRSGNAPLAREALANHYLSFARILAAKLFARRVHDEFEFAEYLQFASVGLLEAIDRYDPEKGASFKTYASHRINGAVLDGIENLSEKQSQIGLKKRLQQERLCSLKEGDGSSTDFDALFARLAEVATGLAIGFMLDGMGMFQSDSAGYADNTYSSWELKQLQQRIRELVESLPEREGKIIKYHYYHGIGFGEIAQKLGVTKGRVSQIHVRALSLLRELYGGGTRFDKVL